MNPEPSAIQPVAVQPVREVHHYHPRGPEPGLAVVLELLPGMLVQTFGIGNIYAGNAAGGVLMMVGYWVACVLNFLLCFVFIGFITWPLTWIAFMIFCPILAHATAKRRQMEIAAAFPSPSCIDLPRP